MNTCKACPQGNKNKIVLVSLFFDQYEDKCDSNKLITICLCTRKNGLFFGNETQPSVIEILIDERTEILLCDIKNALVDERLFD